MTKKDLMLTAKQYGDDVEKEKGISRTITTGLVAGIIGESIGILAIWNVPKLKVEDMAWMTFILGGFILIQVANIVLVHYYFLHRINMILLYRTLTLQLKDTTTDV